MRENVCISKPVLKDVLTFNKQQCSKRIRNEESSKWQRACVQPVEIILSDDASHSCLLALQMAGVASFAIVEMVRKGIQLLSNKRKEKKKRTESVLPLKSSENIHKDDNGND